MKITEQIERNELLLKEGWHREYHADVWLSRDNKLVKVILNDNREYEGKQIEHHQTVNSLLSG